MTNVLAAKGEQDFSAGCIQGEINLLMQVAVGDQGYRGRDPKRKSFSYCWAIHRPVGCRVTL
jgi:hypothetical protein